MYISTYISSATFAWSSKLTVDIDSMGPGLQRLGGQFSNFLLGKVSLEFKLHGMSIFHDIQMATYFGTGWCYSHVVGYAGSPTYTVYVDVTLSRSKVKVTGLLNFRQLPKPCMLAAMTAAPLRGFLVNVFRWQNWESLVDHKLGVKCFEHVVTVNSWTFHIIHFSLILCLCIARPHKGCPQAWILLQ